ncbi:hypothetical protein HH800_02390 [Sphingobium yanoikuyae]|uniref:TIGR02217 family protein n=2 Tax=Sphingobium yanoikuyae TaxID=13690 RepID=A0A6M4G1M1_SPHYA|nr:hypothetical protein HH800_02390 [Sphingobium yanoikuyae]
MDEINWPAGLSPYKVMFYLQPHIGGQESPLTRTRKTYGLSAPRWVARLTFRAGHGYDDGGMSDRFGPRADDAMFFAARLDALIAQLKGGLQIVRFHDFRRPIPQSYLTLHSPAMTIDAASAGDNSIVINREPGAVGPSIGDYIGGDGRPHLVTDVSPKLGSMMSKAGPDGKITLTFEPPLSADIAQDAELEIERVTAPFELVSEDAGQNEGEVGAPIDYVLEFSEKMP